MAELNEILYAEDSANDVELTLQAFKGIGIAGQIVIARDGAEALDYLYCRGRFAQRGQSRPILLLLDLKLPKVSGLEILKLVKSDPNLRSIPVVVLTSSREERDLVEGYRLGVNAFVVKPVDFQEFSESIRRIGSFWALVNEPPPNSLAA